MITCYFEGSKKPAQLRHVVVDMLVIDGNKILLVKRGGEDWFLEKGKWALPGGYLDRDETAEQAAVREVREETGYEAEVVKLFRIVDNPNRPNEDQRQNVALVYLMKPIKKVSRPDHEISEVKWFALDKLPTAETMAFDHLDTIKLYKFTLQKRFRLPFTNISHDFVESWEETLDIMSDPKLVAVIKEGREDIKQGRYITMEKLMKKLNIKEKDLKQ